MQRSRLTDVFARGGHVCAGSCMLVFLFWFVIGYVFSVIVVTFQSSYSNSESEVAMSTPDLMKPAKASGGFSALLGNEPSGSAGEMSSLGHVHMNNDGNRDTRNAIGLHIGLLHSCSPLAADLNHYAVKYQWTT